MFSDNFQIMLKTSKIFGLYEELLLRVPAPALLAQGDVHRTIPDKRNPVLSSCFPLGRMYTVQHCTVVQQCILAGMYCTVVQYSVLAVCRFKEISSVNIVKHFVENFVDLGDTNTQSI